MIDVAIAIDEEAVNVTLSTKAAGAYNADGDFIDGATTTATIKAAIQPASGNQLKDMPEGIRIEAGWITWSRSALNMDDVITHGTISYRVLFVWPRAEGSFWRAALGRNVP